MELSMKMMMIELTDEIQCDRLWKYNEDKTVLQKNDDGTKCGNDEDRTEYGNIK